MRRLGEFANRRVTLDAHAVCRVFEQSVTLIAVSLMAFDTTGLGDRMSGAVSDLLLNIRVTSYANGFVFVFQERRFAGGMRHMAS